MLELPRSLRLAAWGGAALAGRVSLDAAAAGITGADTVHRVTGLPGEDGEVGLTLALGRLRALGATALRLALPAPGDPAGLPGPPALNAAAVDAGEAVVAVGAPYALVPEAASLGSAGTAVRWRVHAALATSPAAPSLAEADRSLQESLREATAELARLDVARWRPEVADALAALRRPPDAEGALPPGHPPRSLRVLASAQRLRTVVRLAGEDAGAAVSARETALRAGALVPLERAARAALAAACNAALEPAPDAATRQRSTER